MVVVGDGLVESCQQCYSQRGFGVRLKRTGDRLECGTCGTRYTVREGLLERVA
jgi:ribosomal protein S27AE